MLQVVSFVMVAIAGTPVKPFEIQSGRYSAAIIAITDGSLRKLEFKLDVSTEGIFLYQHRDGKLILIAQGEQTGTTLVFYQARKDRPLLTCRIVGNNELIAKSQKTGESSLVNLKLVRRH